MYTYNMYNIFNGSSFFTQADRPVGPPAVRLPYHGMNLFSKLTVMRFHEMYINCVWWSCGLFGGLKKASRARHKYLAFLPFILCIVMI